MAWYNRENPGVQKVLICKFRQYEIQTIYCNPEQVQIQNNRTGIKMMKTSNVAQSAFNSSLPLISISKFTETRLTILLDF